MPQPNKSSIAASNPSKNCMQTPTFLSGENEMDFLGYSEQNAIGLN